ncbi:MAG: N-6 DNA methylase [Myxococcota bacterium]
MHGSDSIAFAAALRGAERRLRACGLSGRDAFCALCRHLAGRLGLPEGLWPKGPNAPDAADLGRIPLADDLDLFGLSYERFFSDLFKAGRGQYFTPQPLVALMADLAELSEDDVVLDPTCGAGGFLVEAHRRGADVRGVEIDPELVALCRLNLALVGADPDKVVQADLFAARTAVPTADVILANPPFSVPITNPAILSRFTLTQGRQRVSSDELFFEAALEHLRPEGRLIAVLPRSVLANRRTTGLRQWIDRRFVRRAVVSLPEGIFRPFGGAAAQATIVALQRRPARQAPWIGAVIVNPGYDVTSKVYRPQQPDEIAALRSALAEGAAPTVSSGWLPERELQDDGIAASVPRARLGDLGRIVKAHLRPSDVPQEALTEIDLADVDRSTGEVRDARALRGEDFKGVKAEFEEGDVLFSRLRPNLNKVAIAARPDPSIPPRLVGSTEWVRLQPRDPAERYLLLLAARSSFVRAQLTATSGQTHPRVRSTELPNLAVPDPGDARLLLDAVLRRAHEARLQARRQMDAAAALYEAYGRGEIEEADLIEALQALLG